MLERLRRLYTIFAVLSALLASVVLLTFNKWPSDGPSPLASLSVSLRAMSAITFLFTMIIAIMLMFRLQAARPVSRTELRLLWLTVACFDGAVLDVVIGLVASLADDLPWQHVAAIALVTGVLLVVATAIALWMQMTASQLGYWSLSKTESHGR
ncbi:hypothetical protein CKAH01_14321 [Colletotrichum kahawae]|uniref:Transmembrane protein n=1 Tax=Colletotrichum kahawae TaxID=34407 RepID=A0AAD9YMK2_COLKA|nr:hypothetical protein CKAH01_14321 [Colletotrichum kahawae]